MAHRRREHMTSFPAFSGYSRGEKVGSVRPTSQPHPYCLPLTLPLRESACECECGLAHQYCSRSISVTLLCRLDSFSPEEPGDHHTSQLDDPSAPLFLRRFAYG